MGSVTKRFKRNIRAKNLATKSGIVPPPVRLKRPDGTVKVLFLRQMALIYYRTTMLWVLRQLRLRLKLEHAEYQASRGRKMKLAAFFGDWKKSWIRRMLEEIFPSMRADVKLAAKKERERKRLLRERTNFSDSSYGSSLSPQGGRR